MATSTNRNPARRLAETSSLLGVLEFRPRLVIVLVFLTLTVAVVGWRIFQDAGAPRINALAREAVDLYGALPPGDDDVSMQEAAAAERKILEYSGVPVTLPHDVPEFLVLGVFRETLRTRTAAALRFQFAGDRYLLVVIRHERFLGRESAAPFPEESFLSGEREGKSFVLWEREGASYIMVSDVDVTRTFDLVRRFFT
jgi:hypothetical protein